MQLPRAGDGQGIRRGILGQRRAGPQGSPRRNGHRCHQLCVGADENIILDDGLVLVHTVVVTGNGTGADIHPLADLGVTDVGQVVGFRLPAQTALLDFDKLPTCTSAASSAPGRRRA